MESTSRLYATSFRSPLQKPNLSPVLPSSTAPIRVACQCGDLSFTVPIQSQVSPIRCHCAQCRRFHASAFAALLPLDALPDAFAGSNPKVQRYEGACDGGLVATRLFCARCKSVIGAVPLPGDAAAAAAALLALGCIDDSSIPPAIALSWQASSRDVAIEQGARWWSALPSAGRAPPRLLRGRCACGKCAFTAQSSDEFQTQHCYCGLCRRLSGSVAQTWVPVRPNGFAWTSSESLALVRTTSHGQRHMCEDCGTTLTIVYDSQPDCLWPVAGVLDDDSLPTDLPAALGRTIHICTSMMQTWHELPDDGMPRLMYAG